MWMVKGFGFRVQDLGFRAEGARHRRTKKLPARVLGFFMLEEFAKGFGASSVPVWHHEGCTQKGFPL